MNNTDFSEEISAFHAQQPSLLKQYGSRWVVFAGRVCEGIYADYDQALEFAISKFPNAPFLIRKTDERPLHVPLVVVEAV